MSWGELSCEWLTDHENRPCKPTCQACHTKCKDYKLKHDTDGDDCWCEPTILTMGNGVKVITHQGEQ